MTKISLLDGTDPGLRRESSLYLPLRYADAPPRDHLTGEKWTADGEVSGHRCPDCGRVVLAAIPRGATGSRLEEREVAERDSRLKPHKVRRAVYGGSALVFSLVAAYALITAYFRPSGFVMGFGVVFGGLAALYWRAVARESAELRKVG